MTRPLFFYRASRHVIPCVVVTVHACRDGQSRQRRDIRREAGYANTHYYVHLPSEALQRTYTAGTLRDSKVGGCKRLENIHGQRAASNPKRERDVSNKDKRGSLWRPWGAR